LVPLGLPTRCICHLIRGVWIADEGVGVVGEGEDAVGPAFLLERPAGQAR
jgi:hypothetical protein